MAAVVGSVHAGARRPSGPADGDATGGAPALRSPGRGPIPANRVPQATRDEGARTKKLVHVTETLDSAALDDRRPPREARRGPRVPRVHRAWLVAAVTFVTIIGGAAFNSLPGLLINPLHAEFGWTRGEIGLAVSIDMALYGPTAPFAAALMDRFGIRRVVAIALTMVAAGAVASVWMTASWQLMIYWGLLVGLGTGSMAMVFAATVTHRWFVTRRGLVTGVLTAAGASGQLVFLPLCAWIVDEHG